MSRQRMPAEDRKCEIVETVLLLLASLPIEDLTTERIASEVGISQAAIFRHFPTKNALWLAVITSIEARAEAAWANALSADDAPLDRIRNLIHAQLALIAATPAIPKLIFTVGRLTRESDIHEVHVRIMTRLRTMLLQEAIRLSIAAAPNTPIRRQDIADLFLGLVQGLVLRWQMTGRGFDLCKEGTRLVETQITLLTNQGHITP
ncbi:MAG: TetR/AcrR family transcriptional regulator [Rhodobacteraceae bacterium]|nr:TetR/AcrR family transcriptional regulator [Paracoccaceae bacterium]MCW9043066.1 TetR/AcrR family transcriptional regulator [Pseudopelagicola sp.]